MKEIIRGEEWVLPFYDNNENDNIEYKLSDYVFVEKCDDGYLLLHTITWSLFLLNEFEYENILKYDYFKKWFIVLDRNINEEEIAIKVYLKRSEISQDNLFETVNTFVIFTTNKCNAQCFYCFEKNKLELKNMPIKTADDVANFIINKCKHKAHLQWFGGEPLLNHHVISHICEKIKNSNISYISTMTTNGLLFNEKIINLSKNLWNLNSVQITLDGLYDDYNSVKNYKNTTINAFDILISNIKNILEQSDIKITLRINATKENYKKIEDIFIFLEKNFSNHLENKKLKVLWLVIYQIFLEDYDTFCEIDDYIKVINKNYPFVHTKNDYYIMSRHNLTHCLSDKGKTLVINPFGKLSLCQHWYNSEIIGDIYSGVTNYDKVNEWLKKDGENIKYCVENNCKYLPMCSHFYKCEVGGICQNKNNIIHRLKFLKKSILMTYNEYKKRINQIKNGEE